MAELRPVRVRTRVSGRELHVAGLPGRGFPVGADTLLEGLDRGQFPTTLYLEGPDEGLKAALAGQLSAGQGRRIHVRKFRAAA